MTSPDGGGVMLVLPDQFDPPIEVIEGWLVAVLVALPQPLRLRAALVALDLVAGARTCGSAPIVVRLSVIDGGHTLVISVEDCTPASDATSSGPDLLMVAGLSSEWGVEQRAGGRTRWALIESDLSARIRVPGCPGPGDRTQR